MGQEDCNSISPSGRINLSQELYERLQTGTVSDERVQKYEDDWMQKLANADVEHTIENKISIQETQPILEKLEEYRDSAKPVPCTEHRKEVLSCLQKNHGKTMVCSEAVEAFANCVDEMLSESCRLPINGDSSKNLSYAEKFASGNCN